MNARLTVLVASPDRNYLRLARTVLRTHEHLVYTTSVRPDALRRQVRLRRPDVVLIEAEFEAHAQSCPDLDVLRAVAVIRVVECPDDADSPGPGTIGKWAAPAHLARAVARAADERHAPGSRHLRLVSS